MSKQEFIELLIEELEIEGCVITPTTELESINELDSVGRMVLIGIADEHFGKKIITSKLNEFKTVGDLMLYFGIE